MKHKDLLDWALRAKEKLSEFCDEAQESVGDPGGNDQLPDVRRLVNDFEDIESGREKTWQEKLVGCPDECNELDTL